MDENNNIQKKRSFLLKSPVLWVVICALLICSVFIAVYISLDDEAGTKNTENEETSVPPKNEEISDDTTGSVTDEVHEPLELMKSCIPNEPDWKTAGLESAGLSGVEIGEPHSASFGKLYVLKYYSISKVFCDIFLAVETEDLVYLSEISSFGVGCDTYTYDIDGESGDEIILKVDTGGNGGYGSYDIIVYKLPDDGIKQLYITGRADGYDDGFSARLEAPFKLEIGNEHTGYSKTFDIKGMFEPERIFDEYGIPGEVYSEDIYFDCIHDVKFEDVDNDGAFELICRQYSYCSWTANGIGLAYTTLKYDKSNGEFKVIDASFEPEEIFVIEKNGYYEVTRCGWYFSVYIYDKDGKVLYCDRFEKEPEISLVSDSTVKLCVQTGTGLSTNWAMFFNCRNGDTSETFQYVLASEGDYVIYGDYDQKTEERSIVVQHIFVGSLYYKRYVLENASPVAADFAEINSLGGGKYEITYLVGEDYGQETFTVQLP